MEKEKAVRKKSSEKHGGALPVPPPDPLKRPDLPEAFRRLIGFEEREAAFLKTLKATIDEEEKIRAADIEADDAGAVGGSDEMSLAEECESFIKPLLARSGPSISAALVTEGAIDQLDKLHGILEQLMHMQDENYRLRRCTRDVDTLIGLKNAQKQMEIDPEAYLAVHPPISDADLELEMEYNEQLLLAAGNSASTKRNSSKKQRMRSKSVMSPPEEHGLLLNADRDMKQYPLRRQSAITDIKAKVSKWTKVKAAFKWERANPSLNENGKSTDSGIGLIPINNEVARYLRVPSIPCTGSSADSVLSSSSGHLLSGGSIPPTPGTMSSASSMDDVRAVLEDIRQENNSSISDSPSATRGLDDEARRSRSLDSEATPYSVYSRQLDKHNKNKTPWRKVKEIIKTHRGSLRSKTRYRSVKSTGSAGASRDASPCNSVREHAALFATVSDISPTTQFITTTITSVSCSSSQTSPTRKTYPTLLLTAPPFIDSTALIYGHQPHVAAGSPGSPYGSLPPFDTPTPPTSAKSFASSGRGSTRRSKILTDIACLPEGEPLDMSTLRRGSGRPPPSPLNFTNARQSSHPDSSDTDPLEQRTSPLTQRQHFNWNTSLTRCRKSGASSARIVSAPNSPLHQFEFFNEFESEDLSSGDYSEPCTPHTKLSPKTSVTCQQEEINRKYQELQKQISLEFQAKQKEWERIRNSSIAVGGSSCAQYTQQKDENTTRDFKSSPTPSKPIEENLTADFKKKLQEWRIKQSQSSSSVKDTPVSSSPTKESDKKIDWNLWKTGQLKLEGQGLKQMPDEKDLPEEFQRKLDEWKRIKATGSGCDGLSAKRHSVKSNQNAKCDFGSTKKLKASADDLVKSSEREKLFRLKSLAEPKPAKEVVVQTTKGAMKFEGISRKFTQKLYEWEKARGIGPEASTFALLHPGYRPLVVGNGKAEVRETAPALGRSMSMDSISPHASVPSIISHQHSSLSLNNMDDLIDPKNANKCLPFGSSNSDLDLDDDDDCNCGEEEEPEAVIVEVEDDYVETADALFTASPMIEKQTPIYRYEQTRKEYYAGKREAVFLGENKPTIEVAASRALKNATKMVTSFKEIRHGFKENVEHVQTVLKSLVETLPTLKINLQDNSERLRESVDVVRDLAKNIIDKLTELEATASSKEDLDAKMTVIDGQLNILRKALTFLCKHTSSRKSSRNEDVPSITFTSDSPIPSERNIAIVSIAPTIFQGQVIINQVQVLEDHNKCSELDSEYATVRSHQISDCDSGNKNTTTDTTASSAPAPTPENDQKKLTRKLSNGTKRKTKLRRLGSRQNSRTESDSDEDTANMVADAPRRLKRKTSKAKRLVESNSIDDIVAADDVVYTLKIKPGQMIEQIEVAYDSRSQIEPDPLEILENLTVDEEQLGTNVFVKTKRKLFSPAVDYPGAVIGKDIDAYNAFDLIEEPKEQTDKKLVTNLPPLPQSPGQQRRTEAKQSHGAKEPSPTIRLMIAKYNERLFAERRNSSPLNSSGSGSPVAWRSPILERKALKQTQRLLSPVIKSSSAGNVGRDVRLSEATKILETDAAVSLLVKGVLKSSSAGILSDSWGPTTPEAEEHRITSLACDSLHTISISRTDVSQSLNSDDKTDGLFRKNSVKSSSAPRKIISKQIRSHEDEQEQLKITNTLPKITRKYDATKPPSPRSKHRPVKVSLELNIRSANLMASSLESGPETPLTDRALKLKRAKEEFLKMSAGYRSACHSATEDVWQNRISQISAGSETSADDQMITKSVSLGQINKSGIAKTHHGTRKPAAGFPGFVSLPRHSTRTSKSQSAIVDGAESVAASPPSKFGFLSIAQKLKMVKLRRNSKELPSKMNTVSTLCRQSLMVEIQPGAEGASGSTKPDSNAQGSYVQKSGSAHTMGLGSLLFRRMERAQKLKKSKSIGHLNGSNG